VKTDQQRSDAYTAKTTAATVALIVAATLPDQRTNFADPQGMSALVAKELQIQGLLNAEDTPVPTIFYPFYLAFGRELWALTRKGITSTAFALAAQGIRDKWDSRSFLTDTILDEIALTVFNVVTDGGA
jgi:hypothetical protein